MNIRQKMTPKTLSNIKKYLFIWSIMLYPILLFFVLYIGVNLNSLLLSFQSINIDGSKYYVGFKNFIDFFNTIIKDQTMKTSIINSFKIYIIPLVIDFGVTMTLSYYFFKKGFGFRFYRIIIMIPAIVSSLVIAIVFKKFVEVALPDLLFRFGIEDFPALLLNEKYTFGTTLFFSIWISFSASLIIYSNAMSGIDGQIIESAQIDGVNNIQEFLYIILPMIFPTLATFWVLGIAGFFTNSGALVTFYMYSAPPETYNIGYYMFVGIMRDQKNMSAYSFLASGGIMFTMISAPITLLVKNMLEKINPMNRCG